MLILQHGFKFSDLYCSEKLHSLHKIFMLYLKEHNAELAVKLDFAYTSHPNAVEASELLIALAPFLESFLADFFNIDKALATAKQKHTALQVLFDVKKQFIQRRVAKLKEYMPNLTPQELYDSLCNLDADPKNELHFAHKIQQWQAENNEINLNLAADYAYTALNKTAHSVLFHLPKKLDFSHLLETIHYENKLAFAANNTRVRKGFTLTDNELSLSKALDQAHYCIFCHPRQKDSCSHGLKSDSTGQFNENELGTAMQGCPLEEKISEMNLLKSQACVLGALAVAMIDNPLLAATGHRICNECMRSCIYQKQEPVNIPLIETQTLEDVLQMPYGFEIYSLLSRWNPLNFQQPLPTLPLLHEQPHKVLVAGLGPAGFTLSHYLLNQGLTVVAIDGLKIEPLGSQLSSIEQSGKRVAFEPIKDIQDVYEDLNNRTAYGFGGVAEYGITVRWNKNYLKIIRLLLERRSNFRMYGSTRLGSNLTLNNIEQLGFDHVALCLGAGSPNLLSVPNILARGVRTASDFLMNLQLAGAARAQSTANLQIQLPIAVIGGGLTAIDTATESLEYYAVQVEKVLQLYESLGESIFEEMTVTEKAQALEYIEHAKQLRATPTDKIAILQRLGGATVVYRKALQESTAYRLNYEEVSKAFEEGIFFKENTQPLAIEVDENQACKGIRHKDGFVPARSIFIATGTKPNTIFATEVQGIELDGQYFAKDHSSTIRSAKGEITSVILMQKLTDPTAMQLSFFGDLHPDYNGNVVKAMASAKDGYMQVVRTVQTMPPKSIKPAEQFFEELDSLILTTVVSVKTLAPKIIELIVKSPLAAQNFKPGQFYRVQNFEANALHINGLVLNAEALALTGASADSQSGLISLIILEMGGSSDLCKYFKPQEYLSLMGPTGAPTELPHNQNIMLIGGGLGNAVLFSIGKALKQRGCKVLYFAGYRSAENIFKPEEIEMAADQVVWCCDNDLLPINRIQDCSFKGNIIEAIKAYHDGRLGNNGIPLSGIDRIITIGSDQMMAAVAWAKNHEFAHIFNRAVVAIGSINSPMQCMMKEICAQCLQKHIDPETGEETYVYSCSNQDQELDLVDFKHLNQRLKQNSVQEKICKALIKKHKI